MDSTQIISGMSPTNRKSKSFLVFGFLFVGFALISLSTLGFASEVNLCFMPLKSWKERAPSEDQPFVKAQFYRSEDENRTMDVTFLDFPTPCSGALLRAFTSPTSSDGEYVVEYVEGALPFVILSKERSKGKQRVHSRVFCEQALWVKVTLLTSANDFEKDLADMNDFLETLRIQKEPCS